MTKAMDMQSGNLLKKIIIFTIPVILTSILQLLYNAVDLIVVGNYCGDASLAAVGSTGALTNLIVNLFIGVSVGANVTIARAIGQKNDEKVHKLVHTAILFALISGAFLTVFGVFTARTWLEIMKTTEDCIDLATLYLQIYFGGIIFNMLYNFGAAILNAVGETRKPLCFLGIAGLANVGLNFFFVLELHMDVAGVAIGTIVSEAISSMMIIICLMRKKGILHLDLKQLRLHGRCLKEMIFIGLPAGIQGSLFSISNVFVQSAVNSFNNTLVVLGNTAAANIEGFVYVSMNAFYQGCITFTSQNFGAGKLKNCKKVALYSVLCVIITGIFLGYSAFFSGKYLLRIYTSDSDAIQYGLTRMSFICLTYFLCGIMDVLVGSLRGLGHSIVPMIVSILGACVFRIVWIQTFFKSHHTLQNLYVSYPISWIVTAFVHMISLIIIYHQLKKKMVIPMNIEGEES